MKSDLNDFWAIIPARSGSNGIPNKNIYNYKGQPLIVKAIFDALEVFDNVLFTSESREYHNIVQDALIEGGFTQVLYDGDNVNYRSIVRYYALNEKYVISQFRAEHLAQSHVQLDEVALDSIRFLQLQNRNVGHVCLLQPNSPRRTTTNISDALKLYLISGKKGSVVSGYVEGGFHWKIDNTQQLINGNFLHYIEPINHVPERRVGRQSQKNQLIKENGAIYLTSVKEFQLSKAMRNSPFLFYEMSEYGSIDLDEKEDLEKIKND